MSLIGDFYLVSSPNCYPKPCTLRLQLLKLLPGYRAGGAAGAEGLVTL